MNLYLLYRETMKISGVYEILLLASIGPFQTYEKSSFDPFSELGDYKRY